MAHSNGGYYPRETYRTHFCGNCSYTHAWLFKAIIQSIVLKPSTKNNYVNGPQAQVSFMQHSENHCTFCLFGWLVVLTCLFFKKKQGSLYILRDHI